MQDSLGGNSYTALLATVHPRAADAEESLNTLQFANRCRNVTTQPHINFLDADAESQVREDASTAACTPNRNPTLKPKA